jgi:hypothetical protein
MLEPHTLPELIDAIASGRREIEVYFAALPEAAFFDGDDARWSPAHHLSHLTLGNIRFGRALQGRFVFTDHDTGRSIGIAAVRRLYEETLPTVPAEWLRNNNPNPPRLEPGQTQAEVVAGYAKTSAAMCEAASTWSESSVDAKAIPHPILGPLTVRDMLAFFAVHDRHHLEGVRRRFAS